MKNTRSDKWRIFCFFEILILCIKAIKRKIYKKIQNNEKVTEQKLPDTGKIVTKLSYS